MVSDRRVIKWRVITVGFVLGLIAINSIGGIYPAGAADKSVSVLVEAGSPAHKLVQQTADEFQRMTGHEIEITPVPYIGVYDKLLAEVTTPTGAYDVACIDILWIAAFAHALAPLSDLFTPEVRADLYESEITGGTYKGTVYGMPVWSNAKVLLYRKDLFEDSKERSNFKSEYGYELRVPQTWKEYRDVAKFFTRDTDGDGVIDLHGTAVEGAVHESSVCSWFDHALQAGAEALIVDDKGSVVVNTKPYIDALQFLADIVHVDKSVPPGALEMGPVQAPELFWQGNLAMVLTWAHFYVPANDPEVSKVAGKVGAAPMIAGSSGIGAVPGPWYNIVLKSADPMDIAKKYVQFLHDKNAVVMEVFGVAARKSVFEEYGAKPGYEHLQALGTTLAAAQTKNRPAITTYQQISNDVMVPALQYVLSQEMTPAEAASWAKAKIEDIPRS